MPILSFSSNDIDVITGKKTRTIRKAWKTPLKVGDRLYCYWNLVSKEKMKIFEAFVTDIETVSFEDIKDDEELARQEGFKDCKDMLREFKKMYGGRINPDDEFQIISFEKIDINDWKGDKIDEKAMITKRADILFDSGKFDKSTMCYDAALRIDPNDVYLLNKQGDNLSRLGKFIEAIECYDKALELEPANIYILNNKAIALLNSGNINEALKVSNIAYNYRPSSIGEVSSLKCSAGMMMPLRFMTSSSSLMVKTLRFGIQEAIFFLIWECWRKLSNHLTRLLKCVWMILKWTLRPSTVWVTLILI